MFMEETLRWFGPDDPVSLQDIRQAGASGVVSSLHQIPYGELWTIDAIMERKRMIEAAGLTWSVVESLPVHEDIKTRSDNYREYIANYRQSLRNLAQCGLKIITYNFMPVLDWVRTDLQYKLPDGSITLFYDPVKVAAFDLFILKRKNAEYSAEAEAYFNSLNDAQKVELEKTIVDNFPGWKGCTLDRIREMLKKYDNIDRQQLKTNLKAFLLDVCPVADETGCRMVIHPDDPPFSVLGLPRIFSTAEDIADLLNMVDNPSNGICFCTGSFSGRLDNNLVEMFKNCAHRVGFLHLRSTHHEPTGEFYEANHLEGCVDMYGILKAISEEQARRIEAGRDDWRIPVRPDHGHTMLDDLKKPCNSTPGYSAIGRLRGLAELRGAEFGIVHSLLPQYLKYCTLQ